MSWLDNVSEDFRSDPAITKHEDVNSLVQEHINAQALIGRKGIIVPQEGDDDTVMSSFREALGVPESPDKYTLEGFEPAEGIGWSEDVQTRIQQVAAANNVSDAALTAILKEYGGWAAETVGAGSQKAAQLKEERLTELKKELGGKYDASVGLAGAAVNELTDGKVETITNVKLDDGTLLGDHPDFIRVMSQVGNMMSEKGLVGDKQVNTGGLTPEEASAALNKFEADPEKFDILYNQPQHPAHASIVAERDRLLSFAFPEEE